MKNTILTIIITVTLISSGFSQWSSYTVNGIDTRYTNSTTTTKKEGIKIFYNNHVEESLDCKIIDAIYG